MNYCPFCGHHLGYVFPSHGWPKFPNPYPYWTSSTADVGKTPVSIAMKDNNGTKTNPTH